MFVYVYMSTCWVNGHYSVDQTFTFIYHLHELYGEIWEVVSFSWLSVVYRKHQSMPYQFLSSWNSHKSSFFHHGFVVFRVKGLHSFWWGLRALIVHFWSNRPFRLQTRMENEVFLRWTKCDGFYTYNFMHEKWYKMRVYVGKISHLFHKIPHIRDNICIKSVTFGPSHLAGESYL